MPDRMKKVNSLIQHVVGEIIQNEIYSEEANAYFYTVTKVKVSCDLHYAQVFISVLGSEEISKKGFHCLCKQLKVIQRLMATKIHLKYTPKLHLEYDNTALYASKIDQLIHKIHEHEK